jgi:hypothetical protein
MLKLPPPAWAFLYLIIAGTVSWFYPWRALLDLRIVRLGVGLVAIGVAISIWASWLFRREGTEINPTSETNKSLVVRGPFRFTQSDVSGARDLDARDCILGRGAAHVRSSHARVRDSKLGAYSIRGGENASAVRRRLRRLYAPGSPVDLSLQRDSNPA